VTSSRHISRHWRLAGVITARTHTSSLALLKFISFKYSFYLRKWSDRKVSSRSFRQLPKKEILHAQEMQKMMWVKTHFIYSGLLRLDLKPNADMFRLKCEWKWWCFIYLLNILSFTTPFLRNVVYSIPEVVLRPNKLSERYLIFSSIIK